MRAHTQTFNPKQLKPNTMKKTILSLVMASFIMIAGCKKENSGPNNGSGSNGTNNPPPVTTGTIYFKNTQSDPYKIYVDGYYKLTVSAGQTSSGYTVDSGVTYNIKAEQASGYIFYPTVYTGTAYTNPGGSVTWEF